MAVEDLTFVVINTRNVPSSEAAGVDRAYAIGAIHGRLDLLLELEAMIAADLQQFACQAPLISYPGDYIDRGPHSVGVIDHLATSEGQFERRIFLKGNHEGRMLDFLHDPTTAGPSWLRFGGREAKPPTD